jgi:hypothetical protein
MFKNILFNIGRVNLALSFSCERSLIFYMSIFEGDRTSAEVILYALYLYFLGLSLRKKKGRNHVAIWKWVQRFNPTHLNFRKRVSAFNRISNSIVRYVFKRDSSMNF